MADAEQPDEGIEDDRLRLILPVPPGYDPAPLAGIAAGGRVAAVLMAPGAGPGLLRPFGQEHSLAIFMRDDLEAARGLDGVILTDPGMVAEARQRLGADKVIGALCGIDRHEAMTAGEGGCRLDPVRPGRPRCRSEPSRLAAWWSELFVLPCGVTGLIEPSHVPALASAKIAFALPGPACWRAPEPLRLLADLDATVQAVSFVRRPINARDRPCPAVRPTWKSWSVPSCRRPAHSPAISARSSSCNGR